MTMKNSTNSTSIEIKPQYRQSRSTNKKSNSPHQVRKSSVEKRERQKTLNKLREMVGGDENCSQLEIMQHVIDYIQHLRYTLQPQNDQNRAATPQNEKENRENVGPMQILQHLNNQMANILKS